MQVAVADEACPIICVEGTSETAIDESVTTGALQVRVVLPEIALNVAWITDVPALLQFPDSVAESGPTVATEGVPLDQLATLVKFCVDASE